MSSYRNHQWAPLDGYGDDGASSPMGLRPAIKWLMIANGAVFVVQLLFFFSGTEVFRDFFSLSRGELFSAPWFEFYRLFSYQFLHDELYLFHLLFNLLGLWVFGNGVYDRLGQRAFLVLYFTGGAFGGLVHCMLSPAPVIGASGSIYAVMLFFAFLYPNAPIIFFIIRMKVWVLVAIFVGMNLFSLLTRGGGNVSVGAHLGGAALGTGAYFLLTRYPGTGDRIQRAIRRKVEVRQRKKAKEKEEALDEILAKINEQGLSSLSDSERRILRQASKQANKTRP
ncbi:MAG: rhomboid family intramembrane serine protease [Planctomycetota bacterium]